MRGGRRPGPAIGAVFLGLATLLVGCTIGPSNRPELATSGPSALLSAPQSTVSTMPTGPGGSGRTADPITWSACPEEIPAVDPLTKRSFVLQCGQVEVPKTYDNTGSGTLSISVVKATTTDTAADAPPLVVDFGYPGQNGTDRVASVAGALPAEILQHFSVLVMDVRGTGDSVPIDCVSSRSSADLLSLGADPTTPAASTQIADVARTLTFDCGDMVGPDLSDYSTVLAADDLDSIRSALGRQTIDIVGRGAGATLAAVYANRYPGRVGAAVLDGPADPSLTPEKQAAAAAAANEKALVSFGAACLTFPGGCPLGADPVGAVRELVKSLGDAGIDSSDGLRINGGSVLLAFVDQAGTPTSWPELATALRSARQGDTDGIAGVLENALGSDNVEQQQAGQVVYACNDYAQRLGGAALSSAAQAARAGAPLFGPYLVGRVGICGSWPAPESALTALTATGAPPILVVGAVDDPVAPYSGVRSLTAQLDSATLLTWQSGTNGSYPTSSCVTAAVDAYLLKGTMPANGTLCPP